MRSLLPALVILALAAPPALAAWPPCGRAMTTAPKGQTHAVIASDGANGAIVAWQDGRSPRVNIFAQHVSSFGELDPAWPVDGRALLADSLALATADGGQSAPLIVSDGAGGAIVTWQDLRSPVTEFDLYAQHVLATGAVDPAWPANGSALCVVLGAQESHAIAADGAGGAIVAWKDSRPGASVADIYAQHVLASGLVDPAWPSNGLPICTAAGLQEFPDIVADGSGGAIIAWDDARNPATGLDVFAQHVLGSGTVDPAWPANGRVVSGAQGDQGRVDVVSDGAHGAIVLWGDTRVAGTSHVFAQHVLATGAVDPGWLPNGTPLSGENVIESRARGVGDGQGGALVSWQGFTVHLNIYVQHVTAAGGLDPAWPAGGRALTHSDRSQFNAEIVTDGAGGAMVAWQDSFRVVAQHVLASGVTDAAYPDSGRQLCAQTAQQEGGPMIVAAGAAGAIVSWTDASGGLGPDILALQVLDAGTVDAPPPAAPALAFAPPSPNPARGRQAFSYALPRPASVTLAVYDLAGRRVRMLATGAQSAGTHAADWDLRDERGAAVRPGVYFARLEAEGRVFLRKLVTVD